MMVLHRQDQEVMTVLREWKVGLVCLGIALIAATGMLPAMAEDTLWHVKAVHPKGRLLDIKAVDPDGKLYDVKAIEQEGNVHMLDVKAFVDGRRHPVKVVVSEDRYAPVKALDVRGKNLEIKAVTPEGKQLDVKGVRR
jgi:ribosomal protein L10